ncbi:hypothetical protein EG878_14770 [Enterococcus faecalis]|nr:hypothetical protein EG878_14770 [Enterococcus faecalis]
MEPLYYSVKLGNVYLEAIHIEGSEVISLKATSDVSFAHLIGDKDMAKRYADLIGGEMCMIVGDGLNRREFI